MTYPKAILEALNRSGRSDRDVSIAAVGHESAIRSLKRGLDLRGSTIQALCRELGIEFYIGPHREVAAVDLKRLRVAIETAEESLAVAGREMKPNKKAQLVLAIYELFADTHPVSKQRLVELVRSVA